ncbi:hypothetical protein GW796_06595 [archaeon]|nr:hypothetical protein [archaeon]
MTETVEKLKNNIIVDTSGKWVNISEIEKLILAVAQECATTVYPEDMELSSKMRLRIDIMNDIKSKFGI